MVSFRKRSSIKTYYGYGDIPPGREGDLIGMILRRKDIEKEIGAEGKAEVKDEVSGRQSLGEDGVRVSKG